VQREQAGGEGLERRFQLSVGDERKDWARVSEWALLLPSPSPILALCACLVRSSSPATAILVNDHHLRNCRPLGPAAQPGTTAPAQVAAAGPVELAALGMLARAALLLRAPF
jgi:hypothetical protein